MLCSHIICCKIVSLILAIFDSQKRTIRLKKLYTVKNSKNVHGTRTALSLSDRMTDQQADSAFSTKSARSITLALGNGETV